MSAKPPHPSANDEEPPLPSDRFTVSGSLIGVEARPDAGLAGESLEEALPSDGLGIQVDSELIPPTPDGKPVAAEAKPEVEAKTKPEEVAEPAPQKPATEATPEPAPGDSSQADKPTAKHEHKGRVTLIVGVSLLLIVILFTVLLPNPNRYQWLVFGMLAALGGACIATVLSGFLEVESKQIKAGGALAVFAVVFWVFYSEIPERPGPSVAIAGGERALDLLSQPAPVTNNDGDESGTGADTTGLPGEAETDDAGLTGETDAGATGGDDGAETAGPLGSDDPADSDALFAPLEPRGGR